MRRLIAVAVGLMGLTSAAADDAPAPATIAGAFGERAEVPRLVTRVYPVADLVVPPIRSSPPRPAAASEATPFPLAAPSPSTSPEHEQLEHLAELSVILQNVIEPESWELSGGPGRVAVHGNTLSLIVRQSPEIQEEVDALLAALRQAAELEIEVVLEWFCPREEDSADDPIGPKERTRQLLASLHGPLEADQADQLRQALRDTCDVIEDRLTLHNGGSASSAMGSVVAVVAGDQRSIRVQLQYVDSLSGVDEDPRSLSRRIPEGQTVAIPLQAPWFGEGDFKVLLLTARLIEVPERTQHRSPPPSTVSGAPPQLLPTASALAQPAADHAELFLPAPPTGSLPIAGWEERDPQASGNAEIQLVAGRRAARRHGRYWIPVGPSPEKCDPLHERKVLEEREAVPQPGAPPEEEAAAPPAVPPPAEPPASPPPTAQTPLPNPEPAAPLRDEERERAQIAEAERRLREMLEQRLAEEREQRLREQLPIPSAQPDPRASRGREGLPPEADAETEARLRAAQEQTLRQLRELMARQRELLREAEPRPGELREPNPDEPVAPPVAPVPHPLRPLPPTRESDAPPHAADELERHILHAAEHLEAAGLPDLARQVRQQARERLRERFEQRLREIEEQIERLRREAEAIRGRFPSPRDLDLAPDDPGGWQRREAAPPPDRQEPDPNRPEPDPERRQPPPPAPPERPHPPPEKILHRPLGLPR